MLIGPDQFITVTVLRSMVGGEVKLGVSAPAEVEVHREEVFERIQKGKNPP